MKDSKIEWTDHTFNPWVGCTKVSPGCDHCYAEAWAKRAGKPKLWEGAERQKTSASYWMQPYKWNKEAAASRTRRRVFCASLADVFDNQVPRHWRNDLWQLVHDTPYLDWLLLTKRPQNIMDRLPQTWNDGWANVWLGVTAVNQHEFDRDWPHLRAIPARVRFLSYEPALGPLRLHSTLCDQTGSCPVCAACLGGLHWVICGGESGPKARPMHPDWARGIRNDCAAAGVPFFFKQWGEWHWLGQYAKGTPLGVDTPSAMIMEPSTFPEGVAEHPICMSRRGGKKRAGRLLDSVEHNDAPSASL